MQPMSLYSILLIKLLSLIEVVRIERVKSTHRASASCAHHAWVVRGDEEGGTGWVKSASKQIVLSVGTVVGRKLRAIDRLRKASRRTRSAAEVSPHHAGDAYNSFDCGMMAWKTVCRIKEYKYFQYRTQLCHIIEPVDWFAYLNTA